MPLGTSLRACCHCVHALVVFAEDHFPRRGLKDAGDRNIDRFRDHLLCVIYDDHGAVIQISHALIVFLALFEDEDPHGLARQDDRLQRIGQLINVEHFDPVQLSHFIQIEVVGNDFTVVNLGQLDEFHIDFANLREVLFDDLNMEVSHFLDALQDIQAAPAAVALHGVGRVSYQLQFSQDELRNHEYAVQKPGFGDVRDAAINNDAGIQYFESLLRRFFPAEDASQGSQVEQVTLLCTNDKAHIGHP